MIKGVVMKKYRILLSLSLVVIAVGTLTACGNKSNEGDKGKRGIEVVSVNESSTRESKTSSSKSAGVSKQEESKEKTKSSEVGESPKITAEEAQNNARETLSVYFAKLLQSASADADRVQVIKRLSVSDGVAEQAMDEQASHQDFSMSLDGGIQVAISGTERDGNTGDVFIKAIIIQPMKGGGTEKQAVYDVKLTSDGKKIAGLSYNNNFAK